MNINDLFNFMKTANKVSRFGYHDEHAVIVVYDDKGVYSFIRRGDLFEVCEEVDSNYTFQFYLERSGDLWQKLNGIIYEQLPRSELLFVSSRNRNSYIPPVMSYIFE